MPLILAGPIVRRVEPELVTVWVALSEPRTVQLSVWHGLQSDTGGNTLFEGPAPDFTSPIQPDPPAPPKPPIRTRRVGDKLHIALLTAKPPAPLLPGQNYAYNLAFGAPTNTVFSATADLKSLELLRDGPINSKPNLALGYSENFLPSFATCPTEITDLNVVHGSCRRVNNELEDGLSWLDDLILDARSNPLQRPHQLLMSGDQIYADDVALPMLPQLIERGLELMGPHEYLPMRWQDPPGAPSEVVFRRADKVHLPPGMRHHLIDTEARFTTKDKHSHIISFGDFCAMYLFVWSNVLWDIETLPNFDELIADLIDTPGLPPNWGSIFIKRVVDAEKEIDQDVIENALNLLFNQIDADMLRKVLKDETRGKKDFRELHGLNLDNLSKDKLGTPPAVERNRFRPIYDHAIGLVSADPDDKRLEQFCRFLGQLKDAYGSLYEKEFSDDRRKAQVKRFHAVLTKVRRALANVSTYMMFDDHEVTDDWYLNPMWRDRVLTTPLGRAIIRNGLVAYALFQGWGNDPHRFGEGIYAELLDLSAKVAPETQTAAPTVQSSEIARLDELLGLNGGDPPIKWHYSVSGARHHVLALDNRTRRSFVSRIGPPGNIGLVEMEEQVPLGPLPSGIEVLLVIAPLPVMGTSMLDDLIAPLSYRAFDMLAYEDIEGMPGTNPDAIEAWVFDPNAFEGLLKRLETYRRVVLLSGDVHYGASQQMSYWKKGDAEPARFAQFVSSGLRNVMPPYIRTLSQSFAFMQDLARAPIDTKRLAWEQDIPDTLSIPARAKVPPTLRPKLATSPVLLPTHGWPAGTEIARPPDWSWHMQNPAVVDQRRDDERPEPARLFELSGDVGSDFEDAYHEIAARHASQLEQVNHARQIVFTNNLGVVTFELDVDTLIAVHQLYATHPQAPDPARPEVYARHEVALSAPDEQPPTLDSEA